MRSWRARWGVRSVGRPRHQAGAWCYDGDGKAGKDAGAPGGYLGARASTLQWTATAAGETPALPVTARGEGWE